MNAIDSSMRYPAPIAGDFAVPNFRLGDATVDHGMHTKAAVWNAHLVEFLATTNQ